MNKHSEDEKKAYWKNRIANKVKTLFSQANIDMKELTAMCEHIGVKKSDIDEMKTAVANAINPFLDKVNKL